jgi:hypothetical protein
MCQWGKWGGDISFLSVVLTGRLSSNRPKSALQLKIFLPNTIKLTRLLALKMSAYEFNKLIVYNGKYRDRKKILHFIEIDIMTITK